MNPLPDETGRLPGPFLWGVATSAYQAEGGYNGKGRPQTNWATAELHKQVAVCGAAAEFWTRFESDFELCRQMGLRAFRMGIEWSRIQPSLENKPGPPPDFDDAALDHYAKMLASCRRHGMEPIVTLHHFVHPAWLGSDPWFEPGTPALFASYAARSVEAINRKLIGTYGFPPLRCFITINEPNMLALNTYLGNQFPTKHPLGFRAVERALNGLLTAHVAAYNGLHDLYEQNNWPVPQVTLNTYCSDLYWSDKVLLDLLSLAERGIARGEVREHIHRKGNDFDTAFKSARLPLRKDIPYFFGSIMKRIGNWVGYTWFDPDNFGSLIDAVYASPRPRLFDYIAIDYYDPFTAHVFRLPVFRDHEFTNKSFRSWMLNAVTSKWWDWRVLPHGLRFFCKCYSEDFGRRPVLIAENGMALRRRPDNSFSLRRDQLTRSQFLRIHVGEVIKMAGDGIPVFGYLHWSLFDNYEWGSYTPRFGLFSIDFTKSRDRLVEDHLHDRPSVTYENLIREAASDHPE